MSASLRDLEHAAQLQFVRAQKAEQKAEDIQHALNLMLNLGFERFHTALTMDGAVHEFELGIVRNLSAPDGFDSHPFQRAHALGELFSGGRCSLKAISTRRHSTKPNSGRCRSTLEPEVNFEIFSRKLQRSSRGKAIPDQEWSCSER